MVDACTTYGTIDAARLAGVSVRQLTHWAARGYLRPAYVPGQGQGYKQLRWEARDIEAAARFGALSSALGGLLATFGQALAVSHDDDEVVGVLLDEGRFHVTVEVRRA